MKLRRGRARYKIPPHSSILGVAIEHKQQHYVMCQVAIGYYGKPKAHFGFPSQFAIIGNKIEFWPIPDRACVARVRYAPPIKEF